MISKRAFVAVVSKQEELEEEEQEYDEAEGEETTTKVQAPRFQKFCWN